MPASEIRSGESLFGRRGIDLDSLTRLKDVFGDAGKLTEEEFVCAFGEVLGGSNAPNDQLSHLFMKIDADSDGKVDWEEFTNYMFLDTQDVKDILEEEQQTFMQSDEGMTIFGTANGPTFKLPEPITKMIRLKDNYISCSKDGIRVWNGNTLELGNVVTSIAHGSTDYVTCCTVMAFCNRLAVGSMADCITFYDLNNPNDPRSKRPVCRIKKKQLNEATPLCMSYWHDSENGEEVLFVGDDTGAVTVFRFDDDPYEGWTVKGEKQPVGGAVVESTIKPSLRYRHHTDHVTQVTYIEDIQLLLTSSLDSTIKLIDMERNRIKRDFSEHRKAVYCFTWCSEPKVFASCGLERHIMLWSPYSALMCVKLRGHLSSVTQLALNPANGRLISLSVDNVVKVWDVRNHREEQSFHLPLHAGAYPPICSIMADPVRERLVTAAFGIEVWPAFRRDDPTAKTHSKPVAAALYNPGFHQVVSCDASSQVGVWSCDSGQAICKFTVGGDITAACFDESGRRLVVGSTKGDSLKVLNFSNGCLLKTLIKSQREGNEGALARFMASQPRRQRISDYWQKQEKFRKHREKVMGLKVHAPEHDTDSDPLLRLFSHARARAYSAWQGNSQVTAQESRVLPQTRGRRMIVNPNTEQSVLLKGKKQLQMANRHAEMRVQRAYQRSGHPGGAESSGPSHSPTRSPTPQLQLLSPAPPGAGMGGSHRRASRAELVGISFEEMRQVVESHGRVNLPSRNAPSGRGRSGQGHGYGSGSDGESDDEDEKAATMGTDPETTSILYIVHTSPPQPGQPAMQTKLVVSAGWDRYIYVWREHSAAQEQDSFTDAVQEMVSSMVAQSEQSAVETIDTKNSRDNRGKEQGYILRMPESSRLPRRRPHRNGNERPWERNSTTQSTVWQLKHQKNDPREHWRQHSVVRPGGRQPLGHTDDILCLVHCPPSLIVSGGEDGHVIVWHLNSGKPHLQLLLGAHTSTFSASKPAAVMTLCYLHDWRLVCAGDARGGLSFICPRVGAVVARFNLGHAAGESICAMEIDRAGDLLMTADGAGYIKVFDLEDPAKFRKKQEEEGAGGEGKMLKETSRWRAHDAAVTQLQHLERQRLLDTYIVSAAKNGEVKLWTVNGALVGVFGQRGGWDMYTLASYREDANTVKMNAVPALTELELICSPDLLPRTNSDPADALASSSSGSPAPTHHDKIDLEQQKQEKHMARPQHADSPSPGSPAKSHGGNGRGAAPAVPRVGEVWVQKNAAGGYEHVFTVSAVLEMCGRVIGWDGVVEIPDSPAEEEEQKEPSYEDLFLSDDDDDDDDAAAVEQSPHRELAIALSEFGKVGEKFPWAKHAEMSALVGRLFRDEIKVGETKRDFLGEARPFKVMFVTWAKNAPDPADAWAIVDTELRPHPLPRPADGERPLRSISRWYMLQRRKKRLKGQVKLFGLKQRGLLSVSGQSEKPKPKPAPLSAPPSEETPVEAIKSAEEKAGPEEASPVPQVPSTSTTTAPKANTGDEALRKRETAVLSSILAAPTPSLPSVSRPRPRTSPVVLNSVGSSRSHRKYARSQTRNTESHQIVRNRRKIYAIDDYANLDFSKMKAHIRSRDSKTVR